MNRRRFGFKAGYVHCRGNLTAGNGAAMAERLSLAERLIVAKVRDD